MDDYPPIRVGVNAVVVSDERLLTVKFDDETGPHYNLPGGGVDSGERIPDALTREVREETTADVTVGQLLFVHEYYPPDHESKYGPTHKLTLFFECELVEPTTPTIPENPDPNQIGVEWLPLETIEEQPLLPELGQEWKRIVESDSTEWYLDS